MNELAHWWLTFESFGNLYFHYVCNFLYFNETFFINDCLRLKYIWSWTQCKYRTLILSIFENKSYDWINISNGNIYLIVKILTIVELMIYMHFVLHFQYFISSFLFLRPYNFSFGNYFSAFLFTCNLLVKILILS